MGHVTAGLRFPATTPGEPILVSASTYVTYRKCPQQAVARLMGHYAADTRPSFRGGLAHRIFARHLSVGPIEEGELEQVCREEIGQAMNGSLGRLALRPSELRGIVAEVGELYQRFKRVERSGLRGTEVELETEVDTGVTLRGTVDAVFDDVGGVRLVDWKTGGLWGAEHQLVFYSLLWALDRGDLPAAAEAVSVATGEQLEIEPGQADLVSCAELISDLVTRARAAFAHGAEAARTAGPWCGRCPVLDTCSEGQSAVTRAG